MTGLRRSPTVAGRARPASLRRAPFALRREGPEGPSGTMEARLQAKAQKAAWEAAWSSREREQQGGGQGGGRLIGRWGCEFYSSK